MPQSLKRRIIRNFFIVLMPVIIIILFTIIFTYMNPYAVLIQTNEPKYFNAKYLFLFGDNLICLKDSEEYNKRKDALDASQHNYMFYRMPVGKIAFIEIITYHENGFSKEIDYEKKYLGKYKVDVSGHSGFLYLALKNGKISGTIRFPDWAHGVFESLKNVWVNKGKIGFIRSIETAQEMKRVGAPNFFTQEFHGEYKDDGNIIEGHYLNRGANMMWRAFKVK